VGELKRHFRDRGWAVRVPRRIQDLHLRLNARNARRVQGHVFLLNTTRDVLASAIEFVSAAADLDARRTVALPPSIASRIDELLASQARLDWPAPLSGAISI
jgi:hypothetical protein